MPTIWDLLPASLWPTQPFFLPSNPTWPPARPSQSSTTLFPTNPATTMPDRDAQMAEDARRAYDFAMWLFQPPTPRRMPPPSRESSSNLGKFDLSEHIPSVPIPPPPMPPFEGYGEGDRRGREFETDENVDQGIIARRRLRIDTLMEKKPSIFEPYSPYMRREDSLMGT